jgi:hypothetical protein
MGNFYANISLRTTEREPVIRSLRKLKRVAFVSDVQSGWLVVYDRDIETAEPEEVGTLAATLSAACASTLLALSIYDDDVLWLRLYDGCKLIDEYNSAPGYFEGINAVPSGGDSRAIVMTLNVPEAERVVQAILHESEYPVQTERHAALAHGIEAATYLLRIWIQISGPR